MSSAHDSAATTARIGDADATAGTLARDGFCIIPDVITQEQVERVKARLWAAVEALQRSGQGTHSSFLDPNDANVRVYHLPDHGPLFIDLLTWPAAMAQVHGLLGPDPILSNFTANIARPGAEPMMVHSDMALVI